MREILFRGKRIETGEWVEGNFYESGISGAYILQNVTRKTVDARTGEITMRDEPVPFEIEPSTVGQYTGLKDKNGNNIFEGDILALRNGIPRVVSFEDGAFVLENTSIPMRFANKFEVIGNITDNPELL